MTKYKILPRNTCATKRQIARAKRQYQKGIAIGRYTCRNVIIEFDVVPGFLKATFKDNETNTKLTEIFL